MRQKYITSLRFVDGIDVLAEEKQEQEALAENYGVPRGSKAPIRVDPYFKNTGRPVNLRVDP